MRAEEAAAGLVIVDGATVKVVFEDAVDAFTRQYSARTIRLAYDGAGRLDERAERDVWLMMPRGS